jgi:hypothetical protein
MKGLQITTIAMTGAAMIIGATLVLLSVVPITTRAVSERIGTMAVAHNDAQLARDFDKLYPQYKSQLPIRLDDRTTLIELSHRGHVFRLRHLLDAGNTRTAASIGEQNRKSTLSKVCADDDMRMTMKRGVIYEYQYLDRQSRLLGSFDIRNADCAS